MSYDATKPSMTDADWPTAFGNIRENFRAIVQGDASVFTLPTALDVLFSQGADMASAATTDIGAATGVFVKVTGTTAITALGTKGAGVVRFVRFGGALTLTHNATSLILPGAANIVTVANDIAIFISLGGGNWECLSYIRATTAGASLPVQNISRITGANASAPTITGTGFGTGPTYGLTTGSSDVAGTIVVTAGTTPGNSGSVTITFPTNYGANQPTVLVMLGYGSGGAWNARATAIGVNTTSNGSAIINWDNNGVALGAGNQYQFNYLIIGH